MKFLVIVFFLFLMSCGKSHIEVDANDTSTTPESSNGTVTPFTSTWRTTGGSESISLPLRDGYSYNFTVDWGDSSPLSFITSASDLDKTHTYAVAGDYTVVLTGLAEAWYFNNSGDKDKIIDVVEFGNLGWKNLESAFSGCNNLVSFSGGNTSEVTNMSHMFRLNTGLTSLNLSGVNFDTTAVTNMSGMFYGASGLTSLDLTGANFNTSAVTDMSTMFFGASGLTTLDLTGANFDTSAVGSMFFMFMNASGLTSLDLSGANFDTSSVVNMSNMFYGTSSLTTLNLTGHDISSVISSTAVFLNKNPGLVVTCDQGSGMYFTETCF